ncbi:MAG: lipase family protein [Cellvibrionaceae bacterium]
MRFTPQQSSSLANSVYALSRTSSFEKAYQLLNATYQGNFKFSESNLVAGKTGAGILKVKTGFGFLLEGQGNYEGNAVIVFRGTQYLADWLSNANILYSRSSKGYRVHDGFNQAFRSMLPGIKEFVAALPVGTEVHCVGHSLGGALATITGEWVANNSSLKPRVYTFGSPRVGFTDFAEGCTSLLGCERIYRTYHTSDIVPCIPIWPFTHTPYKSKDYGIKTPGLVPGAEWHDMSAYEKNVKKKSWDVLYSERPVPRNDAGIEQWLKKNVRVPSTMEALEWISDAIGYVVRKCVSAVASTIDFVGASMFTIMDKLSYILSKAMRIDELLSDWVLYLMRKISNFLGKASAIEPTDISRETIRNLLTQLSKKANEMAYQALSKTLADGRAI